MCRRDRCDDRACCAVHVTLMLAMVGRVCIGLTVGFSKIAGYRPYHVHQKTGWDGRAGRPHAQSPQKTISVAPWDTSFTRAGPAPHAHAVAAPLRMKGRSLCTTLTVRHAKKSLMKSTIDLVKKRKEEPRGPAPLLPADRTINARTVADICIPASLLAVGIPEGYTRSARSQGALSAAVQQ